jgi:hypothetical protein
LRSLHVSVVIWVSFWHFIFSIRWDHGSRKVFEACWHMTSVHWGIKLSILALFMLCLLPEILSRLLIVSEPVVIDITSPLDGAIVQACCELWLVCCHCFSTSGTPRSKFILQNGLGRCLKKGIVSPQDSAWGQDGPGYFIHSYQTVVRYCGILHNTGPHCGRSRPKFLSNDLVPTFLSLKWTMTLSMSCCLGFGEGWGRQSCGHKYNNAGLHPKPTTHTDQYCTGAEYTAVAWLLLWCIYRLSSL